MKEKAVTEQGRVPESTVLRLSRYHCFLGELQHSGSGRITSREIAEDLGLSEETVRHDLSYVPAKGRPGSGYDKHELYDALCECLDLSAAHPFAAIGNQDVLRGLAVTFPAEDFGLSAAVYFSERAEDAGALVGDQPVHPAADIPKVARGLGIRVALVAVAPPAVEETLKLLSQAGVHGVVMLTPVLRPTHPEGMSITYFRMPCALKSLVNVGVPSCGCEQG